jgi:hypothetical protein
MIGHRLPRQPRASLAVLATTFDSHPVPERLQCGCNSVIPNDSQDEIDARGEMESNVRLG